MYCKKLDQELQARTEICDFCSEKEECFRDSIVGDDGEGSETPDTVTLKSSEEDMETNLREEGVEDMANIYETNDLKDDDLEQKEPNINTEDSEDEVVEDGCIESEASTVDADSMSETQADVAEIEESDVTSSEVDCAMSGAEAVDGDDLGEFEESESCHEDDDALKGTSETDANAEEEHVWPKVPEDVQKYSAEVGWTNNIDNEWMGFDTNGDGSGDTFEASSDADESTSGWAMGDLNAIVQSQESAEGEDDDLALSEPELTLTENGDEESLADMDFRTESEEIVEENELADTESTDVSELADTEPTDVPELAENEENGEAELNEDKSMTLEVESALQNVEIDENEQVNQAEEELDLPEEANEETEAVTRGEGNEKEIREEQDSENIEAESIEAENIEAESREVPEWLKAISGDIDDEWQPSVAGQQDEKSTAETQNYGSMEDILNMFLHRVVEPSGGLKNTDIEGGNVSDDSEQNTYIESKASVHTGADTGNLAGADQKMDDAQFARFAEDMLKEFEKDSSSIENEFGNKASARQVSAPDLHAEGEDAWNESIINDFNSANKIPDMAGSESFGESGNVTIEHISEALDSIDSLSGGIKEMVSNAELNEAAMYEDTNIGFAQKSAVQGLGTDFGNCMDMGIQSQGNVDNSFDEEISVEMARLSSLMDSLGVGSGEAQPYGGFSQFPDGGARTMASADATLMHGFGMESNQSYNQSGSAGGSFNFGLGFEDEPVIPTIGEIGAAMGASSQGFQSGIGAVPYVASGLDAGGMFIPEMNANAFQMPSNIGYESAASGFGNVQSGFQPQMEGDMTFDAMGMGSNVFQSPSPAGAALPFGEIRNQNPVGVSESDAMGGNLPTMNTGPETEANKLMEIPFNMSAGMTAGGFPSGIAGDLDFDELFKSMDVQSTDSQTQNIQGANRFENPDGLFSAQIDFGLQNGAENFINGDGRESISAASLMQNIADVSNDSIDWSLYANRPSQVSNRSRQGMEQDFDSSSIDFNVTSGAIGLAEQAATLDREALFGQTSQFEQSTQFEDATSSADYGFKPLRASDDLDFGSNMIGGFNSSLAGVGADAAVPDVTSNISSDETVNIEGLVKMDISGKNHEPSSDDVAQEPDSYAAEETESDFADTSLNATAFEAVVENAETETPKGVSSAGLPLDLLDMLGLGDDLNLGAEAIQSEAAQNEITECLAEDERAQDGGIETEKHFKIEVDDFDMAGTSNSFSVGDTIGADDWAVINDLVGLNISKIAESEKEPQNDEDSFAASEEERPTDGAEALGEGTFTAEDEMTEAGGQEIQTDGQAYVQEDVQTAVGDAQIDAQADVQTAAEEDVQIENQVDAQMDTSLEGIDYNQAEAFAEAQNAEIGTANELEKSTIRIDLGLGSSTDKSVSIRELDEAEDIHSPVVADIHFEQGIGEQAAQNMIDESATVGAIAPDSLNVAVQDLADMNVPQTANANVPKQNSGKGGRKSIKILLWLLLILIIVGCVVFAVVDLTPYGIDNQAFRETVMQTLGISTIVPDSFWL